MYNSILCVVTKAATKLNRNNVKNKDWACDLVSAFQSLGELLASNVQLANQQSSPVPHAVQSSVYDTFLNFFPFSIGK